MNSVNSNSLYIILNYALNNNIYKLISSIEKFCFSYLSLSLQNTFHLYLVYNNSYILLFPNKIKDPTHLITSNYTEISTSITEALNHFFNSVSQAEEKLSQNDIKNGPIAINVILKKILLELNQKNNSKQTSGDGNFLLSSNNDNQKIDRIILINDSENDFDEINQKYVFLLRKENIKIDILSLNELNKNATSKALCLFTNGFFDNVTKEKNNIEQILIQEYMPIERKEFLQKSNGNIKNTINYYKALSDDDFICSLCHKIFKNKDERNNQNFNNNINSNSNHLNNTFSQMNNMNNMNRELNDGNINRINSNLINSSKFIYSESHRNIFCNNCYKNL